MGGSYKGLLQGVACQPPEPTFRALRRKNSREQGRSINTAPEEAKSQKIQGTPTTEEVLRTTGMAPMTAGKQTTEEVLTTGRQLTTEGQLTIGGQRTTRGKLTIGRTGTLEVSLKAGCFPAEELLRTKTHCLSRNGTR